MGLASLGFSTVSTTLLPCRGVIGHDSCLGLGKTFFVNEGKEHFEKGANSALSLKLSAKSPFPGLTDTQHTLPLLLANHMPPLLLAASWGMAFSLSASLQKCHRNLYAYSESR